MFYIHGIQSHGGWLFETGPALAARGVELHVLDRRGSGRSGGPRGHLPSVDAVLDDCDAALARLRPRYRRIVVVGQSFGGSVLAAWRARGPLPVDALVFCAPALGQQRRRHDDTALGELRRRAGLTMTPVRLKDEDYTSDPRYLTLLAADPLMLRSITDRTRAVMVELEDRYVAGWPPHDDPVFLATPAQDRIIDLPTARQVLTTLAPSATERKFVADGHYIEFTDARRDYWDWLAALVRGGRER
ncbi:alpha/beta hydrolase [Kutzneria buriramensis]|uniref:alpha/beta hydrolase n=1 Tax=Kutzneria buriramensis TaxID=1045776 RepID=UPI001476F1D2|nr:alpha/beta fold hydrolase [Kutzneria buriramensis]